MKIRFDGHLFVTFFIFTFVLHDGDLRDIVSNIGFSFAVEKASISVSKSIIKKYGYRFVEK